METTYSQFACIGAGFSAIGLGVQLQRWYGITDICFFEKEDQLGGTWHINRYPGCAVDIPSVLYSYSFEPSTTWSTALPSGQEVWEYLDHVARKYRLLPRMSFGVEVRRCEWVESPPRWRLSVRDVHTGTERYHEARFVFAATGLLVEPKRLDVPGGDTFAGALFHSARWRHDVDLRNKAVVIFGNGCTASQIVPAIVGQTGRLTQMIRSRQWVMPDPSERHGRMLGGLRGLSSLPGAAWLKRLLVFLLLEDTYRGFRMTWDGARYRRAVETRLLDYIGRKGPEKYQDLLRPDFEVGCKRRVFNGGYLQSLHSDKVRLTDEPAVRIVPEGVQLRNGDTVEADVVIMANGFRTNRFLGDMVVVGRKGETATQHWRTVGGPSAYNCTAMSGFPNFFLLLGPNSATGHTSVVMAIENGINYGLRVLAPVLRGRASVAEVSRPAELAHAARTQEALRWTVFAAGCTAWYTATEDGVKPGWNGMTYPWTQAYFWYCCLWPRWRDWQFFVRFSHLLRVRNC